MSGEEIRKDLAYLTDGLEKVVTEAVTEGFEHDFNEDAITYDLLKRLRRHLNSAVVEGLSDVMRITCEAYKYRGKMEHDFGDVGVVVNIHFSDKDVLEGVGFIEAKRRDVKAGEFPAFDAAQVDRIYVNAPNSFLLLYDYEPAQRACKNVDVPLRRFCNYCYPNALGSTHAVVVPMGFVHSKESVSRQIYRFALPFSYQLCFRYLLGFDLNFAKAPLKSAMEYAESRPTRHLMVITVIYGDRVVERAPAPNHNLYESIEDRGEEGRE